jgi:hypothetical protein
MSQRPGRGYTTAPRCGECGGRALLEQDTAKALETESFGRLEIFRCPQAGGWHVWAPSVERERRV